MFDLPVNERLSKWIELRINIDDSSIDPLQYVWDFWHTAPFIPFNKNINPYHKKSWPSPWEIIAENKYDDFTRSLMIAWTLKLTKKFNNSKIDIKTIIDTHTNREYNLVFIDEKWVINFSDEGPVDSTTLNGSFRLENLIEVELPR